MLLTGSCFHSPDLHWICTQNHKIDFSGQKARTSQIYVRADKENTHKIVQQNLCVLQTYREKNVEGAAPPTRYVTELL